MEEFKSLQNMMKNNTFSIPAYQRAYSWEKDKHCKAFLGDLIDYYENKETETYYFGHFLFEKDTNEENKYLIIDGQQRLTTVVIFLSALFEKLREKPSNSLTKEQSTIYADMVKKDDIPSITTVDYDSNTLTSVIDNQPKNKEECETNSAKRIIEAYEYFKQELKNKDDQNKDDQFLSGILDVISQSKCSYNKVDNPSTASQIFIFENDRGKKPTYLEVLKARFIFTIFKKAQETERERDELLEKITKKFACIYKSIAKLDKRIHEDTVLRYAQKIYYHELKTKDITEDINRELTEETTEEAIKFIKDFTERLAQCFKALVEIFKDADDGNHIELYALLLHSNEKIYMPFILKTYLYGISLEKQKEFYICFEKLLLRDEIIPTRANLREHLKTYFNIFNNKDSITKKSNWGTDIIYHINWLMGKRDGTGSYWKMNLERGEIEGYLHWLPSRALKIILWRYENFLRYGKNSNKYEKLLFNNLEIEHIAPVNIPKIENSGYEKVLASDPDARIWKLGNFLLLNKYTNRSIGNTSFQQKLERYTELEQQKEITKFCQTKTPELLWDRAAIEERTEHLVKFILDNKLL